MKYLYCDASKILVTSISDCVAFCFIRPYRDFAHEHKEWCGCTKKNNSANSINILAMIDWYILACSLCWWRMTSSVKLCSCELHFQESFKGTQPYFSSSFNYRRMTGRKWNLPRKWWYSTVRQIGFCLLMTSLVFSNFSYTLAYDITNLYTKNLSLVRFFILCILYLLFTWFHVSNDKETLRSFFFLFSQTSVLPDFTIYTNTPTPPDFWCSPCCSSLYFSVFFVIVLCLVRPMLPVSLYYQFLIAFSLSVSFFLPWVFLLFYQVYICSFLNAPNLLMSDILNVSSITTKYITVRCGAIRRMHFLTRNIKVRMTGRGPRNEYGTKEPFPEMF